MYVAGNDKFKFIADYEWNLYQFMKTSLERDYSTHDR